MNAVGPDNQLPAGLRRVYLETWGNGAALEVLFHDQPVPGEDPSDRIRLRLRPGGGLGPWRGWLMNVEDAVAIMAGLSRGVREALAAGVPVKPEPAAAVWWLSAKALARVDTCLMDVERRLPAGAGPVLPLYLLNLVACAGRLEGPALLIDPEQFPDVTGVTPPQAQPWASYVQCAYGLVLHAADVPAARQLAGIVTDLELNAWPKRERN